MEQRTEEWKKWRRTGVTATDVAPILGKSKWRTIFDVFDEKMGKECDDNFHMKRGRDYEDKARSLVCTYTGREFEPKTVQHPHHEWARASLDGITEDGLFLVEIKCPFNNPKIKSVMDIPEDHYWQIQWQLFVSGAIGAYYAIYVNGIIECMVEVPALHWDASPFLDVFDQCKWFYENCVVEHNPPFPFKNKEQNTHLMELESKIVEIKKKQDELCEEEKQIKNEIIEMADGEAIKTPHLTLSYKKTSTLDKTALKESGVDLKAFYKESEPRPVLRVKREGKAD